MKLKQLINGGALAATILAAGATWAAGYDGIVFCKATIVQTSEAESDLSVTLPFTTTGTDGQQYTHWNLGEVAAGGVADSWHSEGGPGKFVAHNNGAGAYIYLTSSDLGYASYWDWDGSYSARQPEWAEGEYIFNGIEALYSENFVYLQPLTSLQSWRHGDYGLNGYCLAFTRDVDAKNPTWHMLNRWYRYNTGGYWYWSEDDGQPCTREYIAAYMGYLDSGDYMPFDVKFWAPHENANYNVCFTFKVEAASFPLWEHDVEGE